MEEIIEGSNNCIAKVLENNRKNRQIMVGRNIAKKKNVFSTPFTGCSKLKISKWQRK
ncbi:MAG: hypothetical protein ACLTJ5_05470 [Clostridium sp.]